MLKEAAKRGATSFSYAAIINLIIMTVIMAFNNERNFVPLVPDYAEKFESPVLAVLVQIVLIGLISAAFGAGSVIMELERLNLVAQSIIYFVVTSIIWVPVGCLCFGLGKYPRTLISFGISYILTYVICWVIQYRTCKRHIEEINRRLEELSLEDNVK